MTSLTQIPGGTNTLSEQSIFKFIFLLMLWINLSHRVLSANLFINLCVAQVCCTDIRVGFVHRKKNAKRWAGSSVRLRPVTSTFSHTFSLCLCTKLRIYYVLLSSAILVPTVKFVAISFCAANMRSFLFLFFAIFHALPQFRVLWPFFWVLTLHD